MVRQEKEIVVQEIADILIKSKGVFVTDYQGLNVEKLDVLRKKCREADVSYRVVKNTLAQLAAQKAGYAEMESFFKGPSAIAYSLTDPSAPARVITRFAKETEKPRIKVTLFEGVLYGPDRINEIALLPSRTELLTRLVSGLNGPIQGFAGRLHGLLQKFVSTLDSVRSAKEKG